MPPWTILQHSAEAPLPKSVRSMSAVRKPSRDASRAAAAPKDPPPMMSTSNSRSVNSLGFLYIAIVVLKDKLDARLMPISHRGGDTRSGVQRCTHLHRVVS